MPKPKEEIIDKLAKMLRHEQSARYIGSIAEAEAFATQIQALLSKHGLEMSEIDIAERESDPIDQEWAFSHDKESAVPSEGRRVEWQEELAEKIARSNSCALLITQRSNSVCFVGRPSDRRICLALFRYFTRLALGLSEKAATEQRETQRQKCKMRFGWNYSAARFRWWMVAFRKSFCSGFGYAIGSRLTEQARTAENAAESVPEQSNALIHLRNNREAVAQYVEDLFKDRKRRKRQDNIDAEQDSYRQNWDGFNQGKEAGQGVALTSGALTAG